MFTSFYHIGVILSWIQILLVIPILCNTVYRDRDWDRDEYELKKRRAHIFDE